MITSKNEKWVPNPEHDIFDNLVNRLLHEEKPLEAEYVRAIVGQHKWHDKSAASRNKKAKSLLKRAGAFSIISTLLAVFYSLSDVGNFAWFTKYLLPILIAAASSLASYYTMVLNTDRDDKLAVTEREYAMRSRFALYDLAGGIIPFEQFVERMGGNHDQLTENVAKDKRSGFKQVKAEK